MMGDADDERAEESEHLHPRMQQQPLDGQRRRSQVKRGEHHIPSGVPTSTLPPNATSANGRYTGISLTIARSLHRRQPTLQADWGLGGPVRGPPCGQCPLWRLAISGESARKMSGRSSPLTTRLPSAPLSMAREMLWSTSRKRPGISTLNSTMAAPPAGTSVVCTLRLRSPPMAASAYTRSKISPITWNDEMRFGPPLPT